MPHCMCLRTPKLGKSASQGTHVRARSNQECARERRNLDIPRRIFCFGRVAACADGSRRINAHGPQPRERSDGELDSTEACAWKKARRRRGKNAEKKELRSSRLIRAAAEELPPPRPRRARGSLLRSLRELPCRWPQTAFRRPQAPRWPPPAQWSRRWRSPRFRA